MMTELTVSRVFGLVTSGVVTSIHMCGEKGCYQSRTVHSTWKGWIRNGGGEFQECENWGGPLTYWRPALWHARTNKARLQTITHSRACVPACSPTLAFICVRPHAGEGEAECVRQASRPAGLGAASFALGESGLVCPTPLSAEGGVVPPAQLPHWRGGGAMRTARPSAPRQRVGVLVVSGERSGVNVSDRRPRPQQRHALSREVLRPQAGTYSVYNLAGRIPRLKIDTDYEVIPLCR
jgi:hypothetical protein